VPQPKKDSAESTLPQPELNPLLNPLLAANMGRWAEVYFTSAPEKREQAVAELLRELEGNSSSAASPRPASGQPTLLEQIQREESGRGVHGEREAAEDHAQVSDTDSPLESLPVVHCSACEAVNWYGQRFCGMCGAPLPVEAEVTGQPTEEVLPIASTSWTEHGLSPRDVPEEYASEPQASSVTEEIRSNEESRSLTGGGDDAPEPSWQPPQDLPAFAREVGPTPYRYRAYIGIVLSVLLVGLLYLAWRHASSNTTSSQPGSLPAMPTEAPANPAPTISSENQNTAHASRQNTTPAAPVAQHPSAPVTQPKPHVAAPRNTRIPIQPAKASPAAAVQNGNSELLVARKFLNGTSGSARDSKEAAIWLWKAVSKQNPEAALLLSDLYLRGDGVPKSCDQARLLLDAAARKGDGAAAVRLRNMQNFVCQ
jgi:hypothetical protein